MTEFSLLPVTSNQALDLSTPYRLDLAEFEARPVTYEQLQARELIYRMQEAMQRLPVEDTIQPDTLTPVHRLTRGIYTRELTMPAGSLIVGKRHAQEHVVIMTEGRCTCYTERGQEELVAPYTFMSPAGEKRFLQIHEQTTWITVHRTDATTLEAIEADLVIAEPLRDVLNRPAKQGALE